MLDAGDHVPPLVILWRGLDETAFVREGGACFQCPGRLAVPVGIKLQIQTVQYRANLTTGIPNVVSTSSLYNDYYFSLTYSGNFEEKMQFQKLLDHFFCPMKDRDAAGTLF